MDETHGEGAWDAKEDDLLALPVVCLQHGSFTSAITTQ